MKPHTLITTLFLTIILTPTLVLAASFQVGDAVEVVPDGNAYAAGSLVQVSTEVKGDVFLAGETVQVNSAISEDAFLAGENVTINGAIGDDLHAFGSTVIVNDNIRGDAIIFGQKVMIAPGLRVSGSAIIGGQDVVSQGNFSKDVRIMGQDVVLDGTYYGDVKINAANSLSISEDADIRGDLHLSIPEGKGVVIPEGVVRGEVKKTFMSSAVEKGGIAAILGGFKLFSFLSRLLIGALIIAFAHAFAVRFAAPTSARSGNARKKHFLRLFGIGLFAVVFMPALAVLLLLPVITIPLSIIVIVLWGTLLYVGCVLSGFVVTQMFFPPKKTESVFRIFGKFAAGTLFLFAIRMLPLIGFLVSMVVCVMSFGALVVFYREMGMELRKAKLV